MGQKPAMASPAALASLPRRRLIRLPATGRPYGKTFTAPKTYFSAVTRPGDTKNLKIEDKVSLTWSKVKGADGYTVYLYNSDSKKWEVFTNVKKNTCKIGKKFGSATQQFKVRAYKRSSDKTKFYGGYSKVVKR